jgi:hypothetical protein
MRFYNRQHRHYCGIDLHVKTMYVCILDATGQVLLHRNVPSTPAAFLETIAPYRDDLVVAAGCMFTWYWLADVCAADGITFVLGHALAIGLAHIQNTRAQYNLPAFEKRLAYPGNRDGVVEHFSDPSVRKSIEVDVVLIDQYDALVNDLELTIVREAKRHDGCSADDCRILGFSGGDLHGRVKVHLSGRPLGYHGSLSGPRRSSAIRSHAL